VNKKGKEANLFILSIMLMTSTVLKEEGHEVNPVKERSE